MYLSALFVVVAVSTAVEQNETSEFRMEVGEVNIQIGKRGYFYVSVSPRLPVNDSCLVELQVLCKGTTACSDQHEYIDIAAPNITFSHDTTRKRTIDFEAKNVRQKIAVVPKLLSGNESCSLQIPKRSVVLISIAHSHPLEIVSRVIGWIYFVAWTVSFYPQIYENWRRKSVIGLDFNFLALNLVGFACYSCFNCAMYFSGVIRDFYFNENPHGSEPVKPNDIAFALHAVFACLVTIVQCFIYERGSQRVSYTCSGILAGIGVFVTISLAIAGAHVISWLKLLQFLSYVKLFITLIKYIPQAYYNFRRKSTLGWSIGNVLLDLTGGSFSILQMLLDGYNYYDWKSIFGDFTKFGLGAISVAFDCVFIVQHYVLYRNRVPYLVTVDEDEGGSRQQALM